MTSDNDLWGASWENEADPYTLFCLYPYDNASKSARLFSMHSMKRSMLELQVVFFQIAPTIVYSAQSLKGTKIKGSSKTDFTELTVTGIPGEVNAYGEIDPISFISSSIG